jgi:hypothetical protein
MRVKSFVALVIAAVAMALASPHQASAFGWHRSAEPDGWDQMRTVRHWVYYPRYHHHYHSHDATDPYAYRYEPRGYYPYYNSHYWRPAHEVRKRKHGKLPPYYKAWGHPKHEYDHREWHHDNHGPIRRHHW